MPQPIQNPPNQNSPNPSVPPDTGGDDSLFKQERSSLARFAGLVKLSHTVFGLPFAFASMFLADRWMLSHNKEGVTIMKVVLIVLAFTFARSAAMGFNRIVDRKIDATNPRTATREIPAGVISVKTAWAFTAGSAAIFVGSSFALGTLPGWLSLPSLLIVCGYSLFKRFSWSSHLILGIALALSPGGAWIAITGGFDGFLVPGLLMVAVGSWVGGFDVFYSLQDIDFDKDNALHSIPVRFGVTGALVISGLMHAGTVAALVGVHLLGELGVAHAAGVALISIILLYEHWIVRPSDLTKINKAFFDLNGYVSLAYLVAAAADIYWL